MRNVYSNAVKSPVWIQTEQNGNFSVALETEEHKFEFAGGGVMTKYVWPSFGQSASADRHSVTYLEFPRSIEGREVDMGKFLKGSVVVENLNPLKIVHLKDFPNFKDGETRVVEWTWENPDQKLMPRD